MIRIAAVAAVADRRRGALVRSVLAVFAALTVVTFLAGAVPAAGAPVPLARGDDPETADPFDRLAGCVGAQGRLLVVLLVDESASLRETDPDDQRVAAAQASLRSLDRLRGSGPGGDAISIDVLVSTFSFDFAPVGEWTTLDDDTRAVVEDSIDGLADRDTSMDTDFHNALDGARQELAARATESTEAGGGEVCKSILMFTDGNFTLGARDTAEERERFGTTKSYAPGLELVDEDSVEQATKLGREALCEPGGVADQVRNDRITLVSVALGEGSSFLEAVTTGSSEDRTCGDAATDTPGAYLPAANTIELIRTFDLVAARIGGGVPLGEPTRAVPCPGDDPCDEASVTFSVSSSLRRVHVFAALPEAEGAVVVEPPEGDQLVLTPGEDDQAELDGVPLVAGWIAEGVVTIDLEVPADDSGTGDWRVSLVGGGDEEGVIQVVTFSDIVARLDVARTLIWGAETTIVAGLTTRDGDEVEDRLESPTVVATVTDPITGEAETVELTQDDDGFSAPYTVREEVTAAAVRVSLRLDAITSEGAQISSVSPEVDLAVRRPEGYPQVDPPRLALSSIEADGTAKGTLVLTAPDGDVGCAWFEDMTIRDAPAEAGDLSVAVDGISRDDGVCTAVGSTVEVPVTIDASARASGTVTGHVRVQLARAGGDAPIPTDVPFAFEMARGVDQAKRLAVAGALAVGGLLLPLGLLVLINLSTTRFQDLGNVRAARVRVVTSPQGVVLRKAGGMQALRFVDGDFESLEGLGERRRFTWRGLEFRARTPLNPFAEPHATVAPEEGTADVSREGRRTDIALGLAGSWMFLLDQDATSDSNRAGEIHGEVVAFVAEGAEQAQTARLVDDVASRLPATARRLAALAGVSDTP